MIANEIEGDIIDMVMKAEFDVIVNGCDCECNMDNGFSHAMKMVFQTDKFPMEEEGDYDINKLGCIDFKLKDTNIKGKKIWVVNIYQEYSKFKNGPYGVPFDYDAFRLCIRKLNNEFKNTIIAIPDSIGNDGGGSFPIIKNIIIQETNNCKVMIIKNNSNL